MAMKAQGSGKPRKLLTPCPAGLHPGVFIDVWFEFDHEFTYTDKETGKVVKTRKDYFHYRAEMDPASAGTYERDGEQFPFRIAGRETINPKRLVNEDFAAKIHREIKVALKDDNGKPMLDEDGKPRKQIKEVKYEVGEEIYAADYKRYFDTYSVGIEPEKDDKGEVDFFVGPKHNLHKRFIEWGGDDFVEALKNDDVAVDEIVGRPCKFFVGHKPPKDDGQIWAEIKSWMAPEEGYEYAPAPDFTRKKDEDLPF